jgi:Uma2 family endonuclease
VSAAERILETRADQNFVQTSGPLSLIPLHCRGIVVITEGLAMKVAEYFDLTARPPHLELIFGYPRPATPPSPRLAPIVERLRLAVEDHLSLERSGDVLVAPFDLVISPRQDVVLHPPLAVVLAERREILREGRTIWGAPDIVLEVLTPANARRTRCSKVRWYRDWGVKELWLIDARHHKFEILDLAAGKSLPYIYSGRNSIQSVQLPSFCFEVCRLFR